MGLIREPKEVDFIIQSKPLTEEEEQRLSKFIKQRKQEIAEGSVTSPAHSLPHKAKARKDKHGASL
jgi:hypothetical protein